jgi:hypothetical protein
MGYKNTNRASPDAACLLTRHCDKHRMNLLLRVEGVNARRSFRVKVAGLTWIIHECEVSSWAERPQRISEPPLLRVGRARIGFLRLLAALVAQDDTPKNYVRS